MRFGIIFSWFTARNNSRTINFSVNKGSIWPTPHSSTALTAPIWREYSTGYYGLITHGVQSFRLMVVHSFIVARIFLIDVRTGDGQRWYWRSSAYMNATESNTPSVIKTPGIHVPCASTNYDILTWNAFKHRRKGFRILFKFETKQKKWYSFPFYGLPQVWRTLWMLDTKINTSPKQSCRKQNNFFFLLSKPLNNDNNCKVIKSLNSRSPDAVRWTDLCSTMISPSEGDAC